MAETFYIDAICEAMQEEMERDERVFLIGEDVGVYGGAFKTSAGLIDKFGAQRVIDTPISEIAIVGAASGAALMGMRPIAEMQFIDFITCAYDILVNFAATSRYRVGSACPIVVRGPAGGGVHGGPFHSLNPEAMFMNRPGLKIVAPATAYDAKGLLKAAIRDDDPVVVIENLPIYKEKGDVPLDPEHVTPIGVARVAREGTDLTVVAHSYATVRALHVAERLGQEDGLSVEVVDLRSLRPLDVETVAASVAKTHRALCVEEGWPTYGVTAELAARIQKACFDDLDAPVERVGMAEVPLPYAKELEHAAMPNEDRIAAAVRATAGRTP